MSEIINTGAPHFKYLSKQYRQSNYTFDKFIYECIDNVVKKCNKIYIDTVIDKNGKLLEVRISDNYEHGFNNINQEGINNPLNMAHISNSHDNDNETSEYGVGLKAGSLSTANQLEIITKVPSLNNNYLVVADFDRMSNEVNVNDSFNPRKDIISDEQYSSIHPFNFGSTIKITKIRNDEIYYTTTIEDITNKLLISIGKTYAKLLNNCEIKVNKIKVEPFHDFFNDINCIPFNITVLLYVLEDDKEKEKKYLYLFKKFMYNSYNYYIYCVKEKKWKSCTKDIFENYRRIYKSVKLYTPLNNNGHCVEINSIFTFYSDKFNDKDSQKDKDSQEDETNDKDIELPGDMVNVYKDNRLYGSKSLKKHIDGNQNYTLHEIKFISKKIGKILGITYNKEITMDGLNDLIHCIREIINHNRTYFNANTSTKKNFELCKKAMDIGLFTLSNCQEKGKLSKLSKDHLHIREQMINKHNSIEIIKHEIIQIPENNELVSENNELVLENTELVSTIIDEIVPENTELVSIIIDDIVPENTELISTIIDEVVSEISELVLSNNEELVLINNEELVSINNEELVSTSNEELVSENIDLVTYIEELFPENHELVQINIQKLVKQNDIEIRKQKTNDIIMKLNSTILNNNILELNELIKIESILQ